ncbi:MAG TPA: hypothetical protein VFE94_01510, partial [Candidatus Paceibacterota bacterium]|nr:hypothetical protein [Candidatus Paceibacterota bacterium]
MAEKSKAQRSKRKHSSIIKSNIQKHMSLKRILSFVLLPVFALGLYTFPSAASANGGDVTITNNNSAYVFNHVKVEAETGDNQANGGDGGDAGDGGDGAEGGEGGEAGDGGMGGDAGMGGDGGDGGDGGYGDGDGDGGDGEDGGDAGMGGDGGDGGAG